MLLTIDIGNTHITIGVYKKDKLLFVSRMATDRLRTSDQYAIEIKDIFRLYSVTPNDFRGAIISSVVPELSHAIESAVKILTGIEPIIVGPGVKTGLNIKSDNPAQLGADLVAGAVAVMNTYELPCIIFDLGTATTVSVVDKDGSFLGCVIIAGVNISLDALASRTSQLPNISIDTPAKVIGTNSVDCMRSGAVYGTACMIDGIIDRIEEEIGAKATLVASGGLAKEIIKNCRKKINYWDHLLLEGLRIIYNKNIK